MSDRGQRIYKWVVWIIVIALLAGSIYSRTNKFVNPAITRSAWIELLEDRFGKSYNTVLENENDFATGEFRAISSMNMVGDERLRFYIDDSITDEVRKSIAIQKGIVSERELNKEISNNEAEKKLNKILDFYCGPDNYPEYCSARFEDNVINGTDWAVINHDEDYTSLEIEGEVNKVSEGDIILVRNDYGIAVPLEVTNVEDIGNGKLNVTTEEPSEESTVIEAIDFSGVGDFSYLINGNNGSGNNGSDPENDEEPQDGDGTFGMAYPTGGQPLLLCSTAPNLVAMGKWEEIKNAVNDKTTIKGNETTPEVDLEIGMVYREDEQDHHKLTITPRMNGELINPKLGKGFKWGDTDKDFTDGADITDRLNVNIDSKLKGTVKFKNMSVTADGYFECLDWDDEKNKVNVHVNADVEFDLTITSGVEGRFRLITIPVPIAATGGTVAVEVTIMMVVGIDGTVSFTYTINGGKAGIEMSVAEKRVSPIKDCDSTKFDISADAKLEAGIRAVIAVEVANKYALCDPYIEFKAGASAETLEKKKGFEDYPSCIQLKLYAPVVRSGAHYGESTLTYKALNFLGLANKDTFEVINEDTAYNLFFGKQLHIESDEQNTITILEGGEEVCTHLTDEELAKLLEKKAKEELEKKKREAQEKALEQLEKKLEEWLDNWVQKNCGDC